MRFSQNYRCAHVGHPSFIEEYGDLRALFADAKRAFARPWRGEDVADFGTRRTSPCSSIQNHSADSMEVLRVR
jgi:hypothetical protein